jgi:hypothetical protein
MGAFFDPNAFASGEGVTTEAGLAAGLAGVFVCLRGEAPEIAANDETRRRIPILLMRSGFTRCSP